MNTGIAAIGLFWQASTQCISLESKSYWQASQPGSSMAQNFMSVAGNSSAEGAAGAAIGADTKLAWPPEDTAFNCPAFVTVLFSADEALIVRK